MKIGIVVLNIHQQEIEIIQIVTTDTNVVGHCKMQMMQTIFNGFACLTKIVLTTKQMLCIMLGMERMKI